MHLAFKSKEKYNEYMRDYYWLNPEYRNYKISYAKSYKLQYHLSLGTLETKEIFETKNTKSLQTLLENQLKYIQSYHKY